MSIYRSTKVMPYVYKLTHKETGQFYIGFRCGNKVPASQDLGTKYFSSSKYIKTLGFENFNQEIIAEFLDREAAYEYENVLIEENHKNDLMLNRHFTKSGQRKFMTKEALTDDAKKNQSSAQTGIKNGMFGKIHSDETKNKISRAAIKRSKKSQGKYKDKEALKETLIGPVRLKHCAPALTQPIEEKILKIHKSNKPNKKQVTIDGVFYVSLSEAALVTGIPMHIIRKHCLVCGITDSKELRSKIYSTAIILNGKYYDSKLEAQLELNMSLYDINKLLIGESLKERSTRNEITLNGITYNSKMDARHDLGLTYYAFRKLLRNLGLE